MWVTHSEVEEDSAIHAGVRKARAVRMVVTIHYDPVFIYDDGR